jgi:hypothetical protein
MRTTPLLALAAALSLLCCGSTWAAQSAGHEAVAFDPAAFEAQRSQIERDITRSERYAEIGYNGRRDVLANLAAISRLLEGVSSLEQLDYAERVEVFNLQEQVNSILTKAAEDSRVVCKRQKITGSHRTETQCHTVAQLRIAREDSQKTMRDVMRAKLPEIEQTPTYNRGGGS